MADQLTDHLQTEEFDGQGRRIRENLGHTGLPRAGGGLKLGYEVMSSLQIVGRACCGVRSDQNGLI